MMLFFISCAPTTLEFTYDSEETTISPCSWDTLTKKDRNEQDYWFGPLSFQMMPEKQSLNDTDIIRSLHMNTISLRFILPFDRYGNFRYPYTRNIMNYQDFDDQLCQMGNLVARLKEEGFSIILSGEPHYHSMHARTTSNPRY